MENEMTTQRVREYLGQFGAADRVREFDSPSATVAQAAEVIGCEPARIAKSVGFLVDGRPVLVVLPGDVKTDNAKFRATFGVKARMIPGEDVLPLTGHPVGGVCPFAVAEGVEIHLDESLRRFDTVFPAAGTPASMIEVSIAELEEFSGARGWVDVARPL